MRAVKVEGTVVPVCRSKKHGDRRNSSTHFYSQHYMTVNGHASCHGHFTAYERSLKYPVTKRLYGFQTQYGSFGEENYLLPLHNNSMVTHHTAWTLNQS